jgi:hypothetical protein
MRKDHFTEEALAAAKALAALKYSENPEEQLAFAEAYDFATCERPDGSRYGTGGQCRLGKETTSGPEEKPKTKAKAQAASGPVPPPQAVKELTDKAKEFTYGKPWSKDHQEVWDRVLASPDTKKLGALVRKLNKEVYDEGKYDVSAGFMKGTLTLMKGWLETNQRSGVGAAEEAKRAAMSPEERKRAAAADRIQRGMKAGVVNPRMR